MNLQEEDDKQGPKVDPDLPIEEEEDEDEDFDPDDEDEEEGEEEEDFGDDDEDEEPGITNPENPLSQTRGNEDYTRYIENFPLDDPRD